MAPKFSSPISHVLRVLGICPFSYRFVKSLKFRLPYLVKSLIRFIGFLCGRPNAHVEFWLFHCCLNSHVLQKLHPELLRILAFFDSSYVFFCGRTSCEPAVAIIHMTPYISIPFFFLLSERLANLSGDLGKQRLSSS